MNPNRRKRNNLLGEKVVQALQSRNMDAYYMESREAALEKALSLIPEGSSISWGGSMSISEIGLKDAVCQGNYTVYNRDTAANDEERDAIELQAYQCDYFLTSSNAVTEDGFLVNIDGHANRVSAIAHGPKNVLMIVGMNKIVRDIDAAISRARNEASPINVQRFDLHTPCHETGVCFDCKSPDCVCCQMLITRYSGIAGRIKVILVNDALGF